MRINAHTHPARTLREGFCENAQGPGRLMDELGYDAINVACILGWYEEHILNNLIGLAAKALRPEDTYSFGGIEFPPPERAREDFNYAGQVRALKEAGFDGVKLHGKTTVRKEFGVPLNDPVLKPIFDEAERLDMPLLFHVGDPRSFYDKATAPDWAVKAGWLYDGAEWPSFDRLLEEALGVVEEHPKLRVSFAHFLFLSDDLEKLDGILERYPNVNIDITPGSEMYDEFSKDPAAARAFFEKHGGRILYGTDAYAARTAAMPEIVAHEREKKRAIEMFLRGEGEFAWDGRTVRALGLKSATADAIQGSNFLRFAGTAPRALCESAARAQFDRARERLAGRKERLTEWEKLKELFTERVGRANRG